MPPSSLCWMAAVVSTAAAVQLPALLCHPAGLAWGAALSALKPLASALGAVGASSIVCHGGLGMLASVTILGVVAEVVRMRSQEIFGSVSGRVGVGMALGLDSAALSVAAAVGPIISLAVETLAPGLGCITATAIVTLAVVLLRPRSFYLFLPLPLFGFRLSTLARSLRRASYA